MSPLLGLSGTGYWQYTAHATARGQGRNGQVKSDDDYGLDLRLAMPKSLGGKGDGQNPEMLFAMGYAGAHTCYIYGSRDALLTRIRAKACFLSAMQLVAGKLGKSEMAMKAVVHTQVHVGEPKELEGFGLEVDIQVEGADEELIKAGHEVRICAPYHLQNRHRSDPFL